MSVDSRAVVLPAARLCDVVAAVEARYPRALADSWDRVGLVCGHPEALAARVLLTVDPTLEVVVEAVKRGASLLIAHHPLLLTPVSTVAPDTGGGAVLHLLIENHIGLLTAHTNADVAQDGVSDALARALGLLNTRPLRPLAGLPDTGPVGLGRIGELMEPLPLRELAEQVARVLPAVVAGVRALGDPDRLVSTVAVCGGSGGSLLDDARAGGAQVLITADIKHHQGLDAAVAAQHGGPALLEISHWAGEQLWLPVAAELLGAELAAAGLHAELLVSVGRTDPWSIHVPSGGSR